MCCFVPQLREVKQEPSLQDDDGDAFAHGSVIDGEPTPDIFDENDMVSA